LPGRLCSLLAGISGFWSRFCKYPAKLLVKIQTADYGVYMNFFADVPQHTWKLFGSYANGKNDSKSDFDVILCGVTREDLEHPYFEDLVQQLRTFSVEEGKHLDLFIDQPSRNRLESVFSPDERAIDAGAEAYKAIHFGAKEITVMHLVRACSYLSASGREEITSQEEFIERQNSKKRDLDALLIASREAEGLPAASRGKADLPGVPSKARSY